MTKANEDPCGCKPVYTPKGLQGPPGPPAADTHVVQGHAIVLADITTIGPDITIDTFNSGSFDYKLLGNRMVWFDITVGIDITVAAGGDQGNLNMTIDNLPITFGDPTGGGAAGVTGDLVLSNPTYVSEANIVSGTTGLGSDTIVFNRASTSLPAGTHTMIVNISGTAPGLII